MSKKKPSVAAKRRKPALRTCVICRQVKDKRELLRIVNTKEDGVHIDLTGKRNGRGAYICKDQESCGTKLSKESLERALRTVFNDENWEHLQGQLMRN